MDCDVLSTYAVVVSKVVVKLVAFDVAVACPVFVL